MQPDEEIILRFSKEIVIKFIELGRISPGNFGEQFRNIYWSIKNTIIDARLPSLDEDLFRDDPSEES